MSKNKMIPKLRFPEFVNEGEWEEKTLGDVAERIEEKVNEKKLTTASISAGTGFVSQAEKFSRDISGAQYKNYIVLNEGEFSYNKGNSKRFPQGCIYKLKEFKQVAVPNAFISFRFKSNFVGDFFQGYFDNNYHGVQLMQFITSGARMDGLLNIKADDFFSIVLPTPSKLEQQKIASCLSTLDEVIEAHSQKLELLKNHKKGLMQNLFPNRLNRDSSDSPDYPDSKTPQLRFPEFVKKSGNKNQGNHIHQKNQGSDNGEWEEKTLGEVCLMQAGKFIAASEIKETSSKELFPVYGGNGLRGYATSYNQSGVYSLIGRQGALCGNVTLAQGDFYATEHALVVTPNENVDTLWLFYVLGFLNLNQYATGQAQPGLSVDNLSKVQLFISSSIKEQQKIASCLSSIDNLIAAQTEKIEQLKQHKKGLMQNLFPKI